MKKQEQKVLRIAVKAIESFVRDWQRSPFEYNTEIDIQAEIYSRLVKKLQLRKALIKKIKYNVGLIGYKSSTQKYRKICCEYPTYYYRKGRKRYCYPDIILYRGDIKDAVDKKIGVNYPMLLACEIKYETESGCGSGKEYRQMDINKLNRLLKQRNNKKINGTEYALFLNFKRRADITSKKATIIAKRTEIKKLGCILPLRKGA